MKQFLFAAAALAVALPCGAADKSALAAAFKNTVVSTYPDGRKAELWLNSDGTYTAEGRRHGKSQGKWTLKGDQICLKQSKPPTVPFSYCSAIPNGGVGATWKAKAVTGEAITVKVVKGRR